MELLDVLDKNGNKTGITKTKIEVYRDGDWHKAVHIWIINDQKELLMQRRNPKKETFPNLWAISVAGHVRSKEESIDAAIREVREEIGYSVKKEEFEYLFSLSRVQAYKENDLHVIDDVYLLHLNVDIDHTKLQVKELTDIKYVYYEYLEKIFLENDPDYVPCTEENLLLFKYLHEKYDKN